MDSPRFSRAGEIWYEQKLFQNSLRLKIGQVDANAEFDYVTAAGGFINPSAGFSPTIVGFPTYPSPALSANVFLYPAEWIYAGFGAYADDLASLSSSGFRQPFLIGETGLTHKGLYGLGPGRIAVGLWRNTDELARFDGTNQRGVNGLYAVAEQQVWKKKVDDPNDTQGVSVFAQYGSTSPDVSAIRRHVGLGTSAQGLVPTRDNDLAGIYWSWVQSSGAPGAGLHGNEAALEMFYQWQLTPFLTLQPDLQWIRNPGGQQLNSDAWIFTLRTAITF